MSALIINAYSARNAGDAAITLSTAALLEAAGFSDVAIATRHADEDRAFYRSHALETTGPLTPFPRRGEATTLARTLQLGVGLLLGSRALRRHRRAGDADLIVLSGGGYFYSASRRVNGTLLHAARSAALATASGKRVVMAPQSVGPLRRRTDWAVVRDALRSVSPVVAREEDSAAVLRGMGFADVEVCPDIAFFGWKGLPQQEPGRRRNDRVVIVPMDWSWASPHRSAPLARRYVEGMRDVVAELALGGSEVVLAGHSAMPEQAQDDHEISAAIHASLEPAARRNVEVARPVDVEGLADCYASSDLVIGTRLHSCILALTTGTPAIHLSYQPKGDGTFSLLDLSDRCFQAAGFSPGQIVTAAREILADPGPERSRVSASVRSARERIASLYGRLMERPRPMRIVLVNKFARVTGGADRHVLQLAELLRERGHDVGFLSTESDANEARDGLFVPASVTSATRDGLTARGRARALRLAIWNRDAASAMTMLLDGHQPDVVHAHKLYPQLSVSPVVMARRRGVPVVQTIHDYEFLSANPLDSSGRRVDREEERASYRVLNTLTYVTRRRVHVPAVSRWIAVSESVADAHRTAGIDPVVLRNFVHVSGSPASSPAGREGLIYVGRLTREKGSDVVADVARRLPDTPVTVAGMGADEPLLAEAAAELPNLCFLGRVDAAEVPALLARARVSLMPSRWDEPGPLVALESMAAGTPVVAFDSGGLGEYVRASGAGLAVSQDAGVFAAACLTLLDDERRWRLASDAGLAAVQSLFSPRVYVERLEEVYLDVVAARGRCAGR